MKAQTITLREYKNLVVYNSSGRDKVCGRFVLNVDVHKNLCESVRIGDRVSVLEITSSGGDLNVPTMTHLVGVTVVEDRDEKLIEETEALKWLISTLADVFDYNEFSVIPLDLIQKCLNAAVDVNIFTKEMHQKIHLEIIESGLVTLPTSNKAIQKYGR